MTETTQRALHDGLAAPGVAASSRVVLGSTADAVLQAAANDGAGWVVLGSAKDARKDRIRLGRSVDPLVRRARVPAPKSRRTVSCTAGELPNGGPQG